MNSLQDVFSTFFPPRSETVWVRMSLLGGRELQQHQDNLNCKIFHFTLLKMLLRSCSKKFHLIFFFTSKYLISLEHVLAVQDTYDSPGYKH